MKRNPMLRPNGAFALSALAALAVATLTGPASEATPGDLDPTFGAGGVAVIDEGGAVEYGNGLTVQPDGKIIGVGTTVSGPASNGLAFRLNADGSRDTGFGYRRLEGPGGVDGASAEAVTVQPDGRIVVAGRVLHGNDGAVWRLLPNGAPDPDFGGGDGLVTIDSTQQEYLTDVAVATNGAIVVVGHTTADGGKAAVYRLTASGGYDGTLDQDGALGLGGDNSRAHAVALQPDGRIVVAGYFGAGSLGLAVRRLLPDGAPDTDFGVLGQARVAGNGDTSDVVVQPDGRLLVAGRLPGSDGTDGAVVRFTSTGQVDGSFGAGPGVGARVDLGGYEGFDAVEVLPGGQVVASGYTDAGNEAIVARLDSAGRLDSGFGSPGFPGVAVVPGSITNGYDVAVQPGGRIVTIGDDSKAVASAVVYGLLAKDPSPPSTPTCQGKSATIVGTPGKDKLTGTKKADVIVALGGADKVSGGGGNDVVCAGAGDDTVQGGPGKDTLRGEQGKDRLVGGAGKDRLVGGPQQDDVTQ